MNPWSVFLGMAGLIGVILAIFIQFNSSIDKKIEIKLKDPDFIRMVANEVRLPFVIFDEDKSVIADTGAMNYIENIDIHKDKNKEVSEIGNTPRKFLPIPPILESLDVHIPFENPMRGNKFDLIYKRGEEPI